MTKTSIMNILTYCLFLWIPYYHFKSGNLQPVDIIILLLFFVLFSARKIKINTIIKLSKIYNMIVLLSLYSIFVLVLNYVIYGQEESLMLILETIYAMVMLVVYLSIFYSLYTDLPKQKFYNQMLYNLVISTLMPMFFIITKNHADSSRMSLSFNNPNQLAIFSVINMSIFFYMSLFARSNNLQIRRFISLFIINIDMVFLAISSSRAAFGLLFMYVLSYFLIFQMKQSRENPIFSSLLIAILLAIPAWLLFNHFLMHIELMRDSSIFSMSDLRSDSYIRMFQGLSYDFTNLFYFLFGVGQSSNPMRISNLEFHNNFIGIFNQIGIIGLLIYIVLNVYIVKKLLSQGILYLVPYLCYLEVSFFHFIFRERVSWMFFAVVIFISIYKRIDVLRMNFCEDKNKVCSTLSFTTSSIT